MRDVDRDNIGDVPFARFKGDLGEWQHGLGSTLSDSNDPESAAAAGDVNGVGNSTF